MSSDEDEYQYSDYESDYANDDANDDANDEPKPNQMKAYQLKHQRKLRL